MSYLTTKCIVIVGDNDVFDYKLHSIEQRDRASHTHKPHDGHYIDSKLTDENRRRHTGHM